MNLTRRILVKASESRWLRDRAPRFGFVRGAAARFMPGEKPEDALAAARLLAENGIISLLTQLGENIAERAEADAVTESPYADEPVELSARGGQARGHHVGIVINMNRGI